MKTETFYWDQAHKVSLTAYLHTPSPEMPNLEPRPAMIVLPGGAYLNLSDREAEPIAMAYFAAGFQAFVLRYSLREKARYPAPLPGGGKIHFSFTGETGGMGNPSGQDRPVRFFRGRASGGHGGLLRRPGSQRSGAQLSLCGSRAVGLG